MASDTGRYVMERLYRMNGEGLTITEIRKKDGRYLEHSGVRKFLNRFADLGLVYCEENEDKKKYHLTDMGREFYERLRKLESVI